MLRPSLPVAVVMERTPIASRWASHKWEALGVVGDDGPSGTVPSLLVDDAERTRWLYPGFRLELYVDEAEGYYLNLFSPQPFVFVNWIDEDSRAVPKIVTVSYNEAGRLMDAGGRVDGVPLLPEWRPWLAEFVARNYRPEPKKRIRPPSFKGARRDDR